LRIEVERNVHEARRLALELAGRWDSVLLPGSPHLRISRATSVLGIPVTDYWIAHTLEMLSRCDALLLATGWEKSNGARGEYEYARAHGMSILLHVEAVAE
jgi:Domain of unknown function (DUF4406)